MIRPAWRTCRLASHLNTSSSVPISRHRANIQPLPSILLDPTSTTKSPSLVTTKYLRNLSIPVRQQTRYCSFQRAMCHKGFENTGGSMDVVKGREVLPTNVKPVHYDLTLEPNFEKFSYEGTVIIEYVP